MRRRIFLLITIAMPVCMSLGAQVYTLRAGDISIAVNSDAGARITSLKVGDKELLSSNAINNHFYGSSLWLSPEGKWKGMGLLDAAAYSVQKSSADEMTFTSQRDTVRGFMMKKQFRVSLADSSFIIDYTITNIAPAIQAVSPWEVTRVPTGGLAFFPAGKQPPLAKSNLAISESAGAIWYPYDSDTANFQKMFSNGPEGWTAYIKDRYIFIKKYSIVDSAGVAPNEENVEIYVNKAKTYMELENQGKYQSLQVNTSLEYETKWYARQLPASLQVSVGNKALLDYVRSIVRN